VDDITVVPRRRIPLHVTRNQLVPASDICQVVGNRLPILTFGRQCVRVCLRGYVLAAPVSSIPTQLMLPWGHFALGVNVPNLDAAAIVDVQHRARRLRQRETDRDDFVACRIEPRAIRANVGNRDRRMCYWRKDASTQRDKCDPGAHRTSSGLALHTGERAPPESWVSWSSC